MSREFAAGHYNEVVKRQYKKNEFPQIFSDTRKNGFLHSYDDAPCFDYIGYSLSPSNIIYKAIWAKDGVLHRDDGPALIVARRNFDEDEIKEYFIDKTKNFFECSKDFDNRMSHRWIHNGRTHRVGGPAVYWCVKDVIKNPYYCLDGVEYTIEEYTKKMKKYLPEEEYFIFLMESPCQNM